MAQEVLQVATRDEVHRLVEELPEEELHTAKRFLEFLRDRGGDPLLRTLAEAPEDDEPETEEECRAAEEAWAEYLRGEARPLEDVREELARE